MRKKPTKKEIERLPADHPERIRWKGFEEREAREAGKEERNKKRMEEMKKRQTDGKG